MLGLWSQAVVLGHQVRREVLGRESMGEGVLKLLYWMNQKFSKNSFFNLPSVNDLPDLNHSLKLINTINVFPQQSSFENMDLAVVGTGTGDPVPEGGEDSLG